MGFSAAGISEVLKLRPRAIGVGVLILFAACEVPPGGGSLAGGRSATGGIDLSAYEMVDLTHAFDQNTLYWPTSPTRFSIDTLAYIAAFEEIDQAAFEAFDH